MNNLFSYVLEKALDLPHKKLANPLLPEDLKQKFDLKLQEEKFKGDLKGLIDGVFENSINTQNPRFLNQLYGGSSKEAWLGEFLVAVLNTSMATYEIAPLATLMEKEIFESLNELLNFPRVEGLMVPGGSYANMMGLHCAKYSHNKLLKEKGLSSAPVYKVFVSQDAHYSSEKSMGLMGLGTENLVRVRVDDNHKMDTADLESKIKSCAKSGAVPLCVVSTAGTTVWGSFDPIEEINKICKTYKIWHHVDAAWGGLALWSERKHLLFKGLAEVDSITLDFHKLLASTLTKGIFITAHPDILKNANSGGGTQYIFHNADAEAGAYDTGTYAIQCGRKVDALPVWLQWKIGGTEQFTHKAKQLYDLSSWTVEFLESKPDRYKLLQKPEYMNICFQVLPSGTAVDVGGFNRKMRERLMERGHFMVNFSSTDEDGAFFRLVLSHWSLSKEVLEEFFNELDEIQKSF